LGNIDKNLSNLIFFTKMKTLYALKV